MENIKSVCVYCASSTKIDKAYFEAARQLGKLLAEKGINVINGAGCQGLMAAVSDMAEMSDAVITLPGGCGTLEELLEIITWKQLGLYLKPIVVLNINGYFTPLLNMLAKAIEENFMRPEHVKLWEVANTPEEAVDLLYTIPMWNKEFRKFAAI